MILPIIIPAEAIKIIEKLKFKSNKELIKIPKPVPSIKPRLT